MVAGRMVLGDEDVSQRKRIRSHAAENLCISVTGRCRGRRSDDHQHIFLLPKIMLWTALSMAFGQERWHSKRCHFPRGQESRGCPISVVLPGSGRSCPASVGYDLPVIRCLIVRSQRRFASPRHDEAVKIDLWDSLSLPTRSNMRLLAAGKGSRHRNKPILPILNRITICKTHSAGCPYDNARHWTKAMSKPAEWPVCFSVATG